MLEAGTITLTRKQLYDEVWQLSVAGVARKYNLNYSRLITSCKEADIPFPSSGYWTKLKMGKDVSNDVIALSGPENEGIVLQLDGTAFKRQKKQVEKDTEEIPKTERVEQSINKTTCEEIEETDEKETSPAIKAEHVDKYGNLLPFLEEEERKMVIDKAYELEVQKNIRLHPQLAQYKKTIEEYKSQLTELKNKQYYNPRYDKPKVMPPFVKEVSDEGIQRIIVILDVLFKAIEELGGKINSDLSMQIKKDIVKVRFAEGQDKVTHALTKKEAQELVKYNDAIKNGHYAFKPQIRKYDNVYNGKLRIVFSERKYIRDSVSEKLEDRLGEILIALYERAEEVRVVRERREEEHRKYLEEERRKQELKERKELEMLRTNELVNKAEDYRIACEIREYIAAVARGQKDNEEIQEWINWANRKADWYDPTIAAEDKYLGKRQHEKSKEEKSLEKRTYYPPYRMW